MKKEKEFEFTKKQTIILNIIITIFIILIIFVGIRALAIRGDTVSYKDACKFENGDNWTFEFVQSLGRTCVELDYVTLTKLDRKPFLLSRLEIEEKYCDRPDFFDFTRWDEGCRKFDAKQGKDE